jgi:CelD/BcsL family acetyltransferase involved in cellulose biosynthesis
LFLEAMIRLKRSKFVETNGYDRFDADRCYREYYVQATERLFNTKSIHLSALKLDEQILAANWGFVFAGRFYGLMAGYDRTWKRYAPGRLLSEYLIRWAGRRGSGTARFRRGRRAIQVILLRRTLATLRRHASRQIERASLCMGPQS